MDNPKDQDAPSPESPPRPPTLSLADANRIFSICSCRVCGVGGHTGHQLYKVVVHPLTLDEGFACQQHVSQFLRPKDLKRKRKR